MDEKSLKERIEKIRDFLRHGARRLRSRNQYDALEFNSFDEVFKNCYLGDKPAALNKTFLSSIGVTAVLNAAHGKSPSQINTSQEYYDDVNIKFLGFNLMDDEDVDIDKHFEEAAMFIHNAIDNKEQPGKVLVHCFQGISRSATLVLAYLMIYQSMSLEESIKQVTNHRYIFPNDGFIAHLLMLEDRLRISKKN